MRKINIAVFDSEAVTTVNFPKPTQRMPIVQFYVREEDGTTTKQNVPVRLINSIDVTFCYTGVEVETQNLNGFLTIII